MAKVRGIPGMTGIRGIAAVWVMLYHAHTDAGHCFGLPFLQKIPPVNAGWRGVDLFFMLSGFILMYAHERDFSVLRRESLLRFARLRFMRVYPLNAVVLLLIAILLAFQPGFVEWSRAATPFNFSPGAFICTLFLANRWFLPIRGDWNQPVWSLSLEVLGYLFFPWLAFCALRIKRAWQHVGIILLSLAGSLAFLASRHVATTNDISQMAVVRMAACFVAGIAIFRLWTLTAETGRRWAGWIATASFAGILLVNWAYRGVMADCFLFASLLYGLAFQKGIASKIFSSRVIVFLGEISFPLYLTHVVLLQWLRYLLLTNAAARLPMVRPISLGCWVIASILTATLLHSYVEKPFHALGRRWAGSRLPQ